MDRLSPVSDPVGHPSLPALYCRSPTWGPEGGALWEDSAENSSHSSPSRCAPGPALSTQH